MPDPRAGVEGPTEAGRFDATPERNLATNIGDGTRDRPGQIDCSAGRSPTQLHRLVSAKRGGNRARAKVIAPPPDSLTLSAHCDGADVMIDLRAVPEEAGFVFVQKSDGADRISVLASSVQLLRITKA